MFSFEFFRVLHTGFAYVNANDLRGGPAQCMFGRLGCSTAHDENRLIFFIGSGGPEKMEIRTASLPVLPEQPISFQALDGTRIGTAFVEIVNGHVRRYRLALCLSTHGIPKDARQCRHLS